MFAQGEKMNHALRLGLVLFCLWLALSGYYLALIITLGVLSVVLTTVIALRMEIVDHETYPVRVTWGVVSYWGWLIWQIVKANVDVTRVILSPSLPISPSVIRVKGHQRTKLGLVTYANSITLTPGTVSLRLDDDTIEVHALTEESARDVESGAMDRRVSVMEGFR